MIILAGMIDFMTGFPYWGIIVIVLVNAFIVSRMKIEFNDDETEE